MSSAAAASASCGGCNINYTSRPSYRRRYSSYKKKPRKIYRRKRRRSSVGYTKIYKGSPAYNKLFGSTPVDMSSQTDMNDLNGESFNKKRKFDSQDTELLGSGAYNWRPAARWATENLLPMGMEFGGRQLGMDSELTRRASKWATGKLLGLIGSGAYNINKFAETNELFKHDPDRIINSVRDETGDVIVSQSEFLFDVVTPMYLPAIDNSSNNFVIQGAPCDVSTITYAAGTAPAGPVGPHWNSKPLVLNPGCSRTFPWLSKLAVNFQEYEFVQLVFEYKPIVSDGNTNVNGSVVMFTQYNPNQLSTFATGSTANIPTGSINDKRIAEGVDYANSVKVIKGALHGVECDPSKNSGTREKFIRSEDQTATGNNIDYDLGLFSLGLSNVSPLPFTTKPATTNPVLISTDFNNTLLTSNIPNYGDVFAETPSGTAIRNANAIPALGELWVHYTCKLSKKKVSKTS